MLAQFGNGWLFWQQVHKGFLTTQYTNESRKLTIRNEMKINHL